MAKQNLTHHGETERTRHENKEEKLKRILKKRKTLKSVSRVLIHCNLFSLSYILMLFDLSKIYNENNL